MPREIEYSLVARGTAVLAEYSCVSGNANLVAHRILEKLPSSDSRVSYAQERHLFHVLVSQGFTFLCMADEAFGRRIPFSFLEETQQKFFASFPPTTAQSAAAYEYEAQFSPVLRERMHFWSHDPSADAINRVRGAVADVKSVMIENIEKVLDRGERLEVLVQSTENLQTQAFSFKRDAGRLHRTMWWKDARMKVAIVVIVVLAVYVLISVVCSPTLHC